MKVGIAIRSMGPESTPDLVRHCAETLESSAAESLWVVDHIAIPPDDAEGSGGRYLDPLATLAWIAGFTERIRLGTGVLILPYRPPLPTAKAIATIQELSGGRLLLGVGIGWMDAEFRALGVPRRERGKRTDAMLEFLQRCFAADEVVHNGQPFLFKPRPPRPPIYVGGAAPHALERAVRHGDGWMPMVRDIEAFALELADYRARCHAAGAADAEVVVLSGLPLKDPGAAAARLDAFRELGVDRLVTAPRYATAAEFSQAMAVIDALL